MNKVYKKLRKHLDTMPVGYPRTFTGVEFSLLRKIFTEDHAEIALYMDHTFQTAEEIYARLKRDLSSKILSLAELTHKLKEMASRGCIMPKDDGTTMRYALVPFVVGMLEFQNAFMDRAFYDDARKFYYQGFAIEFLTTAVPQMRTIPVEKSITSEVRINSYENIRNIISTTKKGVAVAECVCRKGSALKGEPCTKSSSTEVCLALLDYHDNYLREGWARSITKEEAMTIVDRAEKDGLIIQTANEQDPQFICLCCNCCCGTLTVYRAVPRPRDFAAANFYAEIDAETCIGCGICVKRCNMDAIELVNKKACIKIERCIGCGVCVPSCKPRSIELKQETDITVPPKNTEELYDIINSGKKNRLMRIFIVVKAFLGFKV